MRLPLYQIDAFANRPFEGNPAAVVPLETWLSDELMQAIAEENNLAETAFFVPIKGGFHIRWFTPNNEVKLCGHATLASAYVLYNCLGHESDTIKFESLSGELLVSKKDEILTLDFPAQIPKSCLAPEALIMSLGKLTKSPVEVLCNEDYLCVLGNEDELARMNPDYNLLNQLDLRGVIVTAPSKEYDFVVRFFAPKYGIPEDSVTGSAYTQLVPYWAEKLSKKQFKAKQISSRGGELFCELSGDRVFISGKAIKYLEGSIEL